MREDDGDGNRLVLVPPKEGGRKPRKAKPSGTPSTRLEAAFKAAFMARYGFPPIVSQGRDRKLLNTLVEQWGEEAVLALVDDFFRATRPGGIGYSEIRRLRWHNIPDFYTGAQILRRLRSGVGDVSDRTASNAHEVAKAMGKQ